MINPKSKFKIYIRFALGTVAIFIFYVWLSGIFFGEQRQVRRFILKGKKAVEAKNILTCAKMISTRYQDKYGNDRSSLIYIARNIFSHYGTISVNIKNIKINLDDVKVEACLEITAQVIGHTQENNRENILEGQEGGIMAKLAKENKKWLLLELEFFEPITIMGQTIGK